MKSRMLGLLAFALIGVSANAMAQTLVGTTTDPTGIDGIVVDGITYDATFGTTPDATTFTYQTAAAIAAGTQLANALNTLNVTTLGGAPPCTFSSLPPEICALYVDAPVGGAADSATADGFPWFENLTCIQGTGTCIINESAFVDWSVASSVPEPATLSLFGLGLAGVGFMRRRKRS
jgi:hypothetical protein